MRNSKPTYVTLVMLNVFTPKQGKPHKLTHLSAHGTALTYIRDNIYQLTRANRHVWTDALYPCVLRHMWDYNAFVSITITAHYRVLATRAHIPFHVPSDYEFL